ncbi:DNA alkylation repair protein [Nocardioides sp. LHG3406-4]|uniref:DNA alkylation repair protein n=1 Tax=Nocardioides sp. LHG3406-4 TaxID=2804575 RepID=UPI003CE76DAE
MSPHGDELLVSAIREALLLGGAAAGNAERAVQQQAYMKSSMPYRGLTAPELRRLLRPILASHRLSDRRTWQETALELWDGATHREEWYAALAVLRHRHYRGWQGPELLELYLHLVRTGAWWDVVDEIAAHLVGDVLAADRAQVAPVIRAWSTDDDLWVRRTGILAQLGHRAATDKRLLADVMAANLEGSPHGSEFFVRKAVGWALRDYARTDPAWGGGGGGPPPPPPPPPDRMSGLSRREALKHLR